MKKNIYSTLLMLAFVIVGSMGFRAHDVAAQTFPSGCSSAIGYSTTTGDPCNGTSQASELMMGCTTPMGYSLTSGEPCSGTDEALVYLDGCSSLYGYSTSSGLPCNGTAVATFQASVPPPVVNVPPSSAPGFPTTGAGGNALVNTLLLLSAGAVAYFSLRMVREKKAAS